MKKIIEVGSGCNPPQAFESFAPFAQRECFRQTEYEQLTEQERYLKLYLKHFGENSYSGEG